MNKVNRISTTVFVHLLLWALLGFVLLTYTPLNWGVSLPFAFWVKHVIHYLILIVLFYFNYRLLAPWLLLRERRTVTFVVVCLLLILVTMFFNEWINGQLHLTEIKKQILVVYKLHERFDMLMLFTLLLVFGLSTSITAIRNRQEEIIKNQELKEQQISSELSFLKAQIHPHFFFNTLNNIYSLSYSDVEASREALHKLSWMMRYILYETQNDMTTLGKEIRFITDYIELMRIRLNKHTSVELHLPERLEDHAISPMMFLPFIENAFKHGISGSGKGYVKVVLQQQHKKVIFMVENTVTERPKEEIDDGGIGLNNTQRRLSLLYNKRFVLSTGLRADQIYEVKLEIELS